MNYLLTGVIVYVVCRTVTRMGRRVLAAGGWPFRSPRHSLPPDVDA